MRTVVGLYDRFESAQMAVQALHEEGFPKENIALVASDSEGEYSRFLEEDQEGQKQDVSDGAAKGAGIGAVLGGLSGLLVGLGALAIPGIGPVIAAGPIVSALAGAGIGAAAGGIIGALVDLGIPEEHAELYAEGIRRGGTLVAVRTDDEQSGLAASILNRYNPVDIEQQAGLWRRNRWQGFDQQAGPLPPDEREFNRAANVLAAKVPVTGDEVNLPVIEEEVRVGRREVEQGGVRVESRVEEKPVEEKVHLRKEFIEIDRQPADREFSGKLDEAFTKWTMEFEEVIDEPVIEKRAHVVEEVRVSKQVEEEEQVIREKLRRQEVDVQRIGPNADWANLEPMFQRHYRDYFSTGRQGFDVYQPAYRYGYDLAREPRFSGYAGSDWPSVEAQARREWENRGERSAWDEVKDAVRYAWNLVKQ